MNSFTVVIVAAGNSARFGGDIKKTHAMLAGQPVWLHSVKRFADREDVSQQIIVVSPADTDAFREQFADPIKQFDLKIVAGGAQRSDSVANGVAAVDDRCTFIAVHDAARPCVDDRTIDRVFAAAIETGAAIAAIPVASTLKRSANGQHIDDNVDRSNLYAAQTPQAFRADDLRLWLSRRDDRQPTDEAQLAQWFDTQVTIVAGSSLNVKITTPDDLPLAAAILATAKELCEPPVAHFDAELDGRHRLA